MRSFWFGSVSLSVAGVALVACGARVDVTTTSGAGGSPGATSTSASTSTSTAIGSTGSGGTAIGECASDADCPAGACVALAPGGYKVCAAIPKEAQGCTMPPGPIPDQCCKSSDCKGGACYPSSELPYCGGVPMPAYNVCIPKGCTTDDGCIHNNPDPWICLPAGAFGYPTGTCFTAYCRTGADCTAQGAGSCRPIANPCCGVPSALACVYAGGCARDADCGSDGTKHCAIDAATGSAVCKPGSVGCPG